MKCKGYIHPDYQSVAETFSKHFEQGEEIGAALCLYHRHQKVLDIWGGWSDLSRKSAWQENTLVPFFSATKAVAASCLAHCHARGLFRYNEPVAKYWADFAQGGKADITIGQLLQHRAGLAAVDHKLSPELIRNKAALESILAQQTPHWPPGDYQGYHVWNIGWYISALLCRIDPKGRRLKAFVEEELLPQLEGEVRIGLDRDFNPNRLAQLKPFSKIKGLFAMPFSFVLQFFNPWSLTLRAMLNPSFVGNHSNFNKLEILQLEMGAGGGVGNARGLASLLDALSDPDHPLYLGPSTLQYLMQYPDPPRKGYRDIVFQQDAFRFHAGFMKPSERHHFSDDASAFGGFGAGGSFVFTEPEQQLTLAYTMNNMSSEMMNMEREVALRESVRETIKSH